MPRTVAAVRLTDVYRFRQTEVRDQAMRVITTLWNRLDPNDLDGSFARLAPAMAVAFTAAQHENAKASSIYLAQFVGLESGTGPVDVQPVAPVAGTTKRGKPIPLVLATGLIETKVALKARLPMSIALRRGLNRLLRSVATEVTQAGRDALQEAMRDEPAVGSYRRVVHGTCGACMSVQSVESPVEHDLNIHPYCQCVTEPVVKPELDEKRVKEWQKQKASYLRKALERAELHPLDRAEITEALERKTSKKVAAKLVEPVQRPTGEELVKAMSDAEKRSAFGEATTEALDAEKITLEDLASSEGDNLVQTPLKDLLPSADSPLTHEQYEALMPKGRGVASDAVTKRTRAALEQTPDGKRLAKAIDSFTGGNSRNIPALRTDIGKRLAGEALDPGREQTIDTLLNAIRNAPVREEPLFRGMRLEGYVEDLVEKYVPGDTLDLNLSSFTSSKKQALSFSDVPAGQKVRGSITNRVRMELVGESRALPVENLSKFAQEKEWMSGGRFKVLSSSYEKSTGTVVVRIQQLGIL